MDALERSPRTDLLNWLSAAISEGRASGTVRQSGPTGSTPAFPAGPWTAADPQFSLQSSLDRLRTALRDRLTRPAADAAPALPSRLELPGRSALPDRSELSSRLPGKPRSIGLDEHGRRESAREATASATGVPAPLAFLAAWRSPTAPEAAGNATANRDSRVTSSRSAAATRNTAASAAGPSLTSATGAARTPTDNSGARLADPPSTGDVDAGQSGSSTKNSQPTATSLTQQEATTAAGDNTAPATDGLSSGGDATTVRGSTNGPEDAGAAQQRGSIALNQAIVTTDNAGLDGSLDAPGATAVGIAQRPSLDESLVAPAFGQSERATTLPGLDRTIGAGATAAPFSTVTPDDATMTAASGAAAATGTSAAGAPSGAMPSASIASEVIAAALPTLEPSTASGMALPPSPLAASGVTATDQDRGAGVASAGMGDDQTNALSPVVTTAATPAESAGRAEPKSASGSLIQRLGAALVGPAAPGSATVAAVSPIVVDHLTKTESVGWSTEQQGIGSDSSIGTGTLPVEPAPLGTRGSSLSAAIGQAMTGLALNTSGAGPSTPAESTPLGRFSRPAGAAPLTGDPSNGGSVTDPIGASTPTASISAVAEPAVANVNPQDGTSTVIDSLTSRGNGASVVAHAPLAAGSATAHGAAASVLSAAIETAAGSRGPANNAGPPNGGLSPAGIPKSSITMPDVLAMVTSGTMMSVPATASTVPEAQAIETRSTPETWLANTLTGSDRVARAEVLTTNTDAVTAVPVSVHDRVQFVERLAQTVSAAQQSEQTLSMRLSPPDFGEIRVEVRSHEGVVSARLETQTSHAQQALLESLPSLQDALSQMGATVDRIDVMTLPERPSEARRDDPRLDQQPEGRRDEQAAWSGTARQFAEDRRDPRRRTPMAAAPRSESSTIDPSIPRAPTGAEVQSLQELNIRV